jgi:hypothetical protein
MNSIYGLMRNPGKSTSYTENERGCSRIILPLPPAWILVKSIEKGCILQLQRDMSTDDREKYVASRRAAHAKATCRETTLDRCIVK